MKRGRPAGSTNSKKELRRAFDAGYRAGIRGPWGNGGVYRDRFMVDAWEQGWRQGRRDKETR